MPPIGLQWPVAVEKVIFAALLSGVPLKTLIPVLSS